MAVYRFPEASQLTRNTDIHSQRIFDHIIEVAREGKNAGQLLNPKSVAIDSHTREIHVIHTCSSHLIGISVFSETGKFIEVFKSEFLWSPWGIAISKGNIYITESFTNCVLQFTKGKKDYLKYKQGHYSKRTIANLHWPKQLNYKQENSERTFGMFHCPKQLVISSNGDIFIADCLNHRIQILDSNLYFKREISHDSIQFPIDVKLSDEGVYVLCSQTSCIHVFSYAGVKIRSLITPVSNGNFFSLDSSGNIYIGDSGANEITLFTKEGILLNALLKKDHGVESIESPQGIALIDDFRLVILSKGPKSLHIFLL